MCAEKMSVSLIKEKEKYKIVNISNVKIDVIVINEAFALN